MSFPCGTSRSRPATPTNRWTALGQPQGLADDRRVAVEHLAPEPMGDDNDRIRSVALVVLGDKAGPERVGQADELEEALADAMGDHRARFVVRKQQCDVELCRHGRPLDGQRAIVEPRELHRRDPATRHIAIGEHGPHRPQILRVRVRQRLEQRRVGRTEDRRRGPDAERERAHGRQRERRDVPQHANRKANVLQQCAHVSVPPGRVADAPGISRWCERSNAVSTAVPGWRPMCCGKCPRSVAVSARDVRWRDRRVRLRSAVT